MSGAGDLKENFLLPLQHDLAIIQPPRLIHQAVELDHLLPGQASLRIRGAQIGSRHTGLRHAAAAPWGWCKKIFKLRYCIGFPYLLSQERKKR